MVRGGRGMCNRGWSERLDSERFDDDNSERDGDGTRIATYSSTGRWSRTGRPARGCGYHPGAGRSVGAVIHPPGSGSPCGRDAGVRIHGRLCMSTGVVAQADGAIRHDSRFWAR